MKNYFLTLFLAGLSLLSFTYNPTAKGFKFTSEEGKFSIVFPSSFQSETITQENNTKTVKISAEAKNQNYMATYTIHQMEMNNPGSLAQTSLDAFVEAAKGTVQNQSEWKIKNNPGIKSIILLDGQDAKIEYRVIIVGKIQYQVIIVSPNKLWDQKAADVFYKSFSLMK